MRLSDTASIVGSLTAAEMVLPLWNLYLRTHEPRVPLPLRDLPRLAIEVGDGYLEGLYTWNEVEEQVNVLVNQIIIPSERTVTAQGLQEWDIVPWGSLGYWAAFAARINNTPHLSGFTVHAAARAYAASLDSEHIREATERTQKWEAKREQNPNLPMPTTREIANAMGAWRTKAYTRAYHRFLARWWELVRCRLAFRIDEGMNF